MQALLQITFHGMDPSVAIEERIRQKATELDRFHDRITSCRVTVEAAHHHKHKGHVYAVRIDLGVPGGEIVVSRERHEDRAHEDVYVAIRDAFDAAVRQLEDYVRQQRGDVKHHETPPRGSSRR